MVDRVLFLPWILTEQRHVANVSCKSGWAPIPGGYSALTAAFPENESVAVDKTAWDWTMPGWVAKAYWGLKIYQCVDADPEYLRMTYNRFKEVVGPQATFRLPDGTRYRQRYWGLMKSGWLLTLSCNSAAQVLQHAVAWKRLTKQVESPYSFPLVWAMGDDMLLRFRLRLGYQQPKDDSFIEAYGKCLATTGCIVKHVLRSREFAGFSFPGKYVVPLYPKKHRYILKHVKADDEQELLKAYFLLYALAGPHSWLDEVRHRARFPVGAALEAWARGLVSLSYIEKLPQWTLG